MIKKNMRLEVVALKNGKEEGRIINNNGEYVLAPIINRTCVCNEGIKALQDANCVDLFKDSMQFGREFNIDADSYAVQLVKELKYINSKCSLKEPVSREDVLMLGSDLFAYNDSKSGNVLIVSPEDIQYVLVLLSKYIRLFSLEKGFDKMDDVSYDDVMEVVNNSQSKLNGQENNQRLLKRLN